MGTIEVDVGNPDLFKPPEYKVLTAGKHLFEVANDLVVESCAAPSENNIVKVESRCQDEDDNKGAVLWENFVIINNPQTEKQRKARSINQAALCQFAVACGVRTKAEIESGKGIPLEEFKGTRFEAITKIENYKDQNSGEPRQRAKVSRYLFEQEETS